MWKLAVVLLAWSWRLISQKWQKDRILSSALKNTLILPIFVARVWKIVNFVPQSFNAKTDQLSLLFVVVCETWPWYYWFNYGVSFPKSDTKYWILSSTPKQANFAHFRLMIAKNGSFFPTKFQCKNWLAILPLCNDTVSYTHLTLPTKRIV